MNTLFRLYGYLGLLPFVIATTVYFVYPLYAGFAISIFMIYANLILAFLSGILWCFEVAGSKQQNAPDNVGLSVAIAFSLMPLVAYGVSLFNLHLAVLLLLLSFLALYFWEMKRYGGIGLPAGYRTLRARLTMIVCLCHALMLWGL